MKPLARVLSFLLAAALPVTAFCANVTSTQTQNLTLTYQSGSSYANWAAGTTANFEPFDSQLGTLTAVQVSVHVTALVGQVVMNGNSAAALAPSLLYRSVVSLYPAGLSRNDSGSASLAAVQLAPNQVYGFSATIPLDFSFSFSAPKDLASFQDSYDASHWSIGLTGESIRTALISTPSFSSVADVSITYSYLASDSQGVGGASFARVFSAAAIDSVPDSGETVALLGLGLVGICLFWRHTHKTPTGPLKIS